MDVETTEALAAWYDAPLAWFIAAIVIVAVTSVAKWAIGHASGTGPDWVPRALAMTVAIAGAIPTAMPAESYVGRLAFTASAAAASVLAVWKLKRSGSTKTLSSVLVALGLAAVAAGCGGSLEPVALATSRFEIIDDDEDALPDRSRAELVFTFGDDVVLTVVEQADFAAPFRQSLCGELVSGAAAAAYCVVCVFEPEPTCSLEPAQQGTDAIPQG